MVEDVVSALSAGVAAGGTAVAKSAVTDSYSGLKSLVVSRFQRQPDAQLAAKHEAILDEFESDPETWQAPLSRALQDAGVDSDDQILAAASELLAVIGGQGQVGDVGTAIGSQIGGVGNTMTNTFGPIDLGQR